MIDPNDGRLLTENEVREADPDGRFARFADQVPTKTLDDAMRDSMRQFDKLQPVRAQRSR